MTKPSFASSNFLTTADAAAHIGLGLSTLEKFRIFGGGPKFCKFGRRVLYRLADLEAWAEDRAVGSTSEADRLPKSKVPQYKKAKVAAVIVSGAG
jgi:hypothetical protein